MSRQNEKKSIENMDNKELIEQWLNGNRGDVVNRLMEFPRSKIAEFMYEFMQNSNACYGDVLVLLLMMKNREEK